MNTKNYLESLEKKLILKKHSIIFGKELEELTPNTAGVYAIWKGKELIYVGESGNVRKRINRDLKDTRNHALRKNIGREEFSDQKGFEEANSRKKFPDKFEKKVNDYLKTCKISFIAVELGRVELEEMIVNTRKPKYNIKKKRK